MSFEASATYENGVLKLDSPIPLEEHQRVKVTVHEEISRAKRSYGLLGNRTKIVYRRSRFSATLLGR